MNKQEKAQIRLESGSPAFHNGYEMARQGHPIPAEWRLKAFHRAITDKVARVTLSDVIKGHDTYTTQHDADQHVLDFNANQARLGVKGFEFIVGPYHRQLGGKR